MGGRNVLEGTLCTCKCCLCIRVAARQLPARSCLSARCDRGPGGALAVPAPPWSHAARPSSRPGGPTCSNRLKGQPRSAETPSRLPAFSCSSRAVSRIVANSASSGALRGQGEGQRLWCDPAAEHAAGAPAQLTSPLAATVSAGLAVRAATAAGATPLRPPSRTSCCPAPAPLPAGAACAARPARCPRPGSTTVPQAAAACRPAHGARVPAARQAEQVV